MKVGLESSVYLQKMNLDCAKVIRIHIDNKASYD